MDMNIPGAIQLLVEMQHQNEKRFEAVAKDLETVRDNFVTVLDAIQRLERIAAAHEQRLDDMEGQ